MSGSKDLDKMQFHLLRQVGLKKDSNLKEIKNLGLKEKSVCYALNSGSAALEDLQILRDPRSSCSSN